MEFNPIEVLGPTRLKQRGEIERSRTQMPFLVQPITLDLSVAATSGNPYKIQIPLKGIFVRDASDPAAHFFSAFHSDGLMQIDASIKMKLNDVFTLPEIAQKTFLTWPAQVGKTITLYVFLDGDFRPGSQISVNAGGVSINSGAAFVMSRPNLAAATASPIVAGDLNRKQATFVNDSGATIWVGASTVVNTGANKGIPVADGASFVWQNTAALYGYHVAGYSDLAVMSES